MEILLRYIFKDDLEGLAYFEVEFRNEELANSYIPPSWITKEVTAIVDIKTAAWHGMEYQKTNHSCFYQELKQKLSSFSNSSLISEIFSQIVHISNKCLFIKNQSFRLIIFHSFFLIIK